MRKALYRLLRAAFIAFTFLPLAMFASHALFNDWATGLPVFACSILLSAFITLLPPYIGTAQMSSAFDPDSPHASTRPDMYWKRPGFVIEGRKFRLPIRWMACIALLAALIAFALFVPYSVEPWGKQLAYGLLSILAGMLAVREIPRQNSGIIGLAGFIIGMILYAAGSIALWTLRNVYTQEALQHTALICAIAYVLLSVLLLNDLSMKIGIHANQGVRPPKRMLRANRMLISAFTVLLAIVMCTSQVQSFFSLLFGTIGAILGHIASGLVSLFNKLFPSGNNLIIIGSGFRDMGQQMLENLGNSSSSQSSSEIDPAYEQYVNALVEQAAETDSWSLAERLSRIFVILLAAVAIGFVVYILFRIALQMIRKFSRGVKRYSSEVDGEYVEEQEQLIESDDERSTRSISIFSRIGRFLSRERYSHLPPRERVRYIVRELYCQSEEDLSYMTIREAMEKLDLHEADLQTACELYERARYSDHPNLPEEPDTLKKAVKM